MVRLGIMSFAHMHAYSYAECINALPETELAGIWDDNKRRGKAAAASFHARFFPDMERFLSSDLDGVIVCSENVHHRKMVGAAAEKGKWVLCEKPLATTRADAKVMVRACKRAGVGLGTAFPCRYLDPIVEAKGLLAQGVIGALLAVSCTNNGAYPGGWFADEKLSGGGAVMDHTVHIADVLRWMTGREFLSVYCELGTRIHPSIHTEDVGSLHLEMEGGLQVAHVASWNRPASFPTWGDFTLEFVGDRGELRVDAFAQKLDVYSDAAGKGEWVPWGRNADLAMIKDFAAAVDERREPAVTGVDGMRAVEVTVAAYYSAKRGCRVVV